MEEKRGISSRGMKIIALTLMIFNHFCASYGDFVSDSAYLFRELHWYITRPSFMLYAFMISEGMVHSSDRRKYILRLFLFALISEIPYDLCFKRQVIYTDSQNVFFTLCIGALAIELLDRYTGETILQGMTCLACCAAAQLGGTDYGFLGVGTIVCFYLFRGSRKKQLIGTGIAFVFLTAAEYFVQFLQFWPLEVILANLPQVNYYIFLELHALAAFPIIAAYNGTLGKVRHKLLFYIAYPAHLLAVYGAISMIRAMG